MGDDMRQTGDDMVLSFLFAMNRCREDCGDLFQISADNPQESREANGHKGHETRPVLN